MDPEVPLIVPEINAEDIKNQKGIIANPNCTTAITLMALYPFHKTFGLKRIFASSYQAVSGTGAKAILELEEQVKQIVEHKPVQPQVYPHQIAFNVLPHIDSWLDNGYTREEMKMENEIVAPQDGSVAQIVVTPGVTVDTGAPLLVLA